MPACRRQAISQVEKSHCLAFSNLPIGSVKSTNPCKSVVQTINDINKAHGGEIKVETKENEGTEFCIVIPV